MIDISSNRIRQAESFISFSTTASETTADCRLPTAVGGDDKEGPTRLRQGKARQGQPASSGINVSWLSHTDGGGGVPGEA